jgi:diacylglycerol O-acyltransferase / wax synthase
MNHQHRFHTLVTHVRVRRSRYGWAAMRLSVAIPVAVGEGGNTTVYFEVLSYAGVLTIAAVVDPDHGPDLDDLIRRLRKELDVIMGARRPGEAS